MPVFLFTDIEGSTQLWETHGRIMGRALVRHDAILQECIEAHGGQTVKHTGDGVFAVFHQGDPLHCVLEIQQRLYAADWDTIGELPVRMALHLGEAEKRADDYFGSAVNRTARLLSAAWGGQILVSEEVIHAYDLPVDAILEDHGVHMLKDLGNPQRIYGLVPSERASRRFPPLRSLSARNHNLPPQPTPFVDRKQELAALLERLEHPSCRLLAIIGSGGIGKTRLALQLAAEKIESFAHGVYQVPLAPLTSATYIFSTIADTLHFPFSGSEEPREQLFNYLREKEMLLVLDNFEHLMSATDIVSDLLQHCPRLKLLVTSRERLNLQEEWAYELTGLPVPGQWQGQGVELYSAVQLFMQNAYRVYPNFKLLEPEKPHVVRICQLVEGIPLGIELASAWVRVIPCSEIVKEIEASRDFLATTSSNVPRRHQSLRAVFEYSWNLLAADERRVLSRLSIFRGGFSRELARAITEASLPLLLALTDKSLVRRAASGRYEMLETLRQYAAEKLDEHPDDKEVVLKRYSHCYANLLQSHNSDLMGGAQKEALAVFEAERENIREAWRFAIERQDDEAIRNALEGLFYFYEIRGWFQEGIHLLEFALNMLEKRTRCMEQELVLGMLLARHGWFAFRLGRYEQTRHDLQASLEIFRRLDVPREAAFALYNLGILSYQLGQYEEADQYLQESLKIRRLVNDRFGTARSLSILGIVARDQGKNEMARALLTESLKLHREVGDRRGISRCLNLLGLINRDLGDIDAARPLLEESLAICREIDDQRDIAFALSILGAINYEEGDYEAAREVVQESLEIREEIGELRGIAFSLHDLGNVARALGKTDLAHEYLQRALRTAISIRALPLALYVLTGIGELRLAQGRAEEALKLGLIVLEHPATFEMAHHRAARIKAEASKQLPERTVSTVASSIFADDLEAVIDELLR